MLQISDIVFMYMIWWLRDIRVGGKYNMDVGCIRIICLDALSVLRIKSWLILSSDLCHVRLCSLGNVHKWLWNKINIHWWKMLWLEINNFYFIKKSIFYEMICDTLG
jgi:hypothetical protein